MRLESRTVSCMALAAVLALTLSGCGKETPPKPAVQAIPVPAVPPQQEAPKADAEKMAAQAARALADKDLASRVKAALVAERSINAHGIDVVAKDGAVTLYGTAETRMRKDMAEKVASGVDGVRSVENKLAIVAGS